MQGKWNHKIFDVNEADFEALSLEIFRFQYHNNPVYREYSRALGIPVDSVTSLQQVPYLPVRFFQSHTVQTTLFEPAVIFQSSGTTGAIRSRHFIRDISLYEESFTKGFELFYGPVKEYCLLGLLPSYLERKDSSLVYMVEKLAGLSEHPQSGFYLYEHEKLLVLLSELEKTQQRTLLVGVTFALLDLAKIFSADPHRGNLLHTVIMETGGMKGRKEEMVRPQVHALLKEAFHQRAIHSEYGMTELLSQAYSKGDGIFRCPPWMKVLVRDPEDPLLVQPGAAIRGSKKRLSTADSLLPTLSGPINIIDLANVYSCSFLAADDIGKLYPDGSFEVLGRMDGSDLRGCSLMVV